MHLAFGSDHAGYDLKQILVDAARGWGHEVTDFGTHGPESVDYADFGEPVARAVLDGTADLGVVLCSNGVGISITANKVPGVRAAKSKAILTVRSSSAPASIISFALL